MPIVAILVLALATLGGCMTLHADLPEEMVRHMARKDGVELGAICSHEGRSFSEGAIVCMADLRMSCDATGRWGQDGSCSSRLRKIADCGRKSGDRRGIRARIGAESRFGSTRSGAGVAPALQSLRERSRRTQQGPHPHQVVGRLGEGEHPAHTLHPSVFRLPDRPDHLAPAEDLLDALALALADVVAHVGRRAIVDCAATVAIVLRHMGRHAELS